MELILGSQSPRRKEILSFFSLPFIQMHPPFDEDAIPFEGKASAYVSSLSEGKARSLALLYPHHAILTADTIVYKEGKVYGKPKTPEQTALYLKELNGNWHSVFTALTLFIQGQFLTEIEETRVLCRSLTAHQQFQYATALPLEDKAGAYMIQGAGSLLVEKIEGCYYNVMGLPIQSLEKVLKAGGIDLWNYLRKDAI